MIIGSTYKMTEMIASYSVSCYIDKITEPKRVHSINLSKNREFKHIQLILVLFGNKKNAK